MLWREFAGRPKALLGTQRVETASKVDWDEYIEDGVLSELHLIASGLRNRDLETYVRAHPEELEKNDEFGRSPLWYASIVGELADIRTLLKYGAILTNKTFSSLQFLLRNEAVDLVEELLSSGALKSPFKEELARTWFLNFYPPRVINEVLTIDRLFLGHGFDVNHRNFAGGKTLLMHMVRHCYRGLPLRLKQLLDHGADLELTDICGKTVLHHCIETCPNRRIDLEAFNVLVPNGARLDYRIRDGTTILHALIINVIHLKPIKIILHSDISGLVLDAKDSDGYTAFELLILRARVLRQDVGDRSVSLKGSHVFDYIRDFSEYYVDSTTGKWMWRAEEPDMERNFLAAFEALLHQVQEVQGIPPEEQYPSVESVLDQEAIDAEASRLEGLPGSWPE